MSKKKDLNSSYLNGQDPRVRKMASGHTRWYYPESGIWNERYMSEKRDQLTPARNTRELKIILQNLPKRCREILDAPCGFGRISNLLAKRGYDVTGTDINRYFIKLAQKDAEKKNVHVRYLVKDILKTNFKNRFDAVLNIFTSIGYLESEKNNELFLKKLCNAVKPGGRLIIETMNPIAMFRRYRKEAEKNTNDGKKLHFRRHFDARTSTMTTQVREIKSGKLIFSGANIIRLYYPHELVKICKIYNCSIDRILDQEGKERDIIDSLRMWLIFKKTKL